MKKLFPGARVRVFDAKLFRNDRSTPLSMTMQRATVVRWYGQLEMRYSDGLTFGPYDSLIDVVFDHDGRLSRGHFADLDRLTVSARRKQPPAESRRRRFRLSGNA
jgi:hypothetical protein